MMAQKEVKDGGTDPEFITYLLKNAVHETYFFVGKEKTKIGAVKLMLAAHSNVLRCELLDSPLAEKGNVYLEDISPRTFNNLLRYVYGFNKISNLSFDEADDLLYAADKYLIKNLKGQLALRLMDLLNYQNICSLLNNPACHTVLELDAKITEILQFETDAVFESPDFINLRVEGFIKILEQDALMVSEMEVWKAALKWAKNKGCSVDTHSKHSTISSLNQKSTGVSQRNWRPLPHYAVQEGRSLKSAQPSQLMEDRSEGGLNLRRCISQLKHIRIRTFKHEEICKEIIPTNVLSDKEVVEICASFGKGKHVPVLMGFSDRTDLRQLTKSEFTVKTMINSRASESMQQTCFTIQPRNDIVLLPFEFQANRAQSSARNHDYYDDYGYGRNFGDNNDYGGNNDSGYQCECIIEITPNNLSCDSAGIVMFNEMVSYGQIFQVPLPAKYRRLSSNEAYTVTITFNRPHQFHKSNQIHTCENFLLQSNSNSSNRGHYSNSSNRGMNSPLTNRGINSPSTNRGINSPSTNRGINIYPIIKGTDNNSYPSSNSNFAYHFSSLKYLNIPSK